MLTSKRVEWEHLIEHPHAGCSLEPCQERAEALLDREPVCLDCADAIIERLSIPRHWRPLMPPLAERISW